MENKFNRFKEYRVREMWFKPSPNQAAVDPRVPLHIDEQHFRNACNHPDVYFSIKKYPLEAKMCDPNELHKFDSVAALFFDLDGHSQGITTKHLVAAAYRLSEFLIKEIDLHEDELMIWWSGRGFHLAVPAEIMMSQPTSGVEQNYKLFAAWARRTIQLHQEIQVWNHELNLYENKLINLLDSSIYHKRALIRIPDTANSNSRFRKNLKKTFMPFDALKRLNQEKETLEQIRKLTLIIETNPWGDSRSWV